MISWLSVFGDRLISARELIEVHRRRHSHLLDDERRLSDALEEFFSVGDPTAKGVGKMLAYRRDRIVGGLQIVRGTVDRDGVLRWMVRKMPT